MQDSLPSVYDYQSARRFLLDYVSARQKRDPAFSVRRWSKEMALSSNALLVMLLQGKRPIRLQHAKFLAKGLNLSSQEKLYFQALIQFESASAPEERELCSLWLSELHPGDGFRVKEVEEYQVAAHWVHSAIMALTDLGRFDGTARSACRLLQGKVPEPEIRAAIERLVELKYLVPAPAGRLKAAYPATTTRDDVASAAVRNHHREAMRLADRALDEVPLDKREYRACSFVVPSGKIALAKEMIRKFQYQLVQSLSGDETVRDGQLCQFNVQFFQLTESPGAAPEDEGVDTESNRRGKTKE